jgi:hypothetical protein
VSDTEDHHDVLDVVVRPTQAGASSLVVIECKDWNRPIGIEQIDELESAFYVDEHNRVGDRASHE